MKTKILLGLLAGVAGCTTEAPRSPEGAAPAAPATKQAPAAVEKKKPAPAPKKPPAAEKKAAPEAHAPVKRGKDIKWAGPVRWRTWEEGLAEAARTGRPICLVVYADWCPRCRELAPVFADPEVATLAEKLVLIRQDADEKPAWLTERFQRFGGYVPRIFFLDPKGEIREDITSGHPRYPYFYTPRGIDRLKDAMRRAAAG